MESGHDKAAEDEESFYYSALASSSVTGQIPSVVNPLQQVPPNSHAANPVPAPSTEENVTNSVSSSISGARNVNTQTTGSEHTSVVSRRDLSEARNSDSLTGIFASVPTVVNPPAEVPPNSHTANAAPAPSTRENVTNSVTSSISGARNVISQTTGYTSSIHSLDSDSLTKGLVNVPNFIYGETHTKFKHDDIKPEGENILKEESDKMQARPAAGSNAGNNPNSTDDEKPDLFKKDDIKLKGDRSLEGYTSSIHSLNLDPPTKAEDEKSFHPPASTSSAITGFPEEVRDSGSLTGILGQIPSVVNPLQEAPPNNHAANPAPAPSTEENVTNSVTNSTSGVSNVNSQTAGRGHTSVESQTDSSGFTLQIPSLDSLTEQTRPTAESNAGGNPNSVGGETSDSFEPPDINLKGQKSLEESDIVVEGRSNSLTPEENALFQRIKRRLSPQDQDLFRQLLKDRGRNIMVICLQKMQALKPQRISAFLRMLQTVSATADDDQFFVLLQFIQSAEPSKLHGAHSASSLFYHALGSSLTDSHSM